MYNTLTDKGSPLVLFNAFIGCLCNYTLGKCIPEDIIRPGWEGFRSRDGYIYTVRVTDVFVLSAGCWARALITLMASIIRSFGTYSSVSFLPT